MRQISSNHPVEDHLIAEFFLYCIYQLILSSTVHLQLQQVSDFTNDITLLDSVSNEESLSHMELKSAPL